MALRSQESQAEGASPGEPHLAPEDHTLNPDDPAYPGQAIYTKSFMRAYDAIVWFNGRFAWRCPPNRLIPIYSQNVSDNHLEVGVGSGYLLDKCELRSTHPTIVLLDLNASPLAAAARRLRRLQPRVHRANALEGFGLDNSFGSIGMNWLLHCLPGSLPEKAVVFDHCAAALAPEGVVFGSTVLSGGVEHTRLSRAIMGRLNSCGVFNNRDDNLWDLEAQLNQRFKCVFVHAIGSVGVFRAQSVR